MIHRSIPSQSSYSASITETQQQRLWDALHERLRSSHEQQLLEYVDATIKQFYPSYCSNDGRVIDRRLAQRIGVNPGTISRLRGGGSGAMTRLTHFLSMMYFCGTSWEDVGFKKPQHVVLDGIIHLFPIVQQELRLAETPSPSEEQILVLYFATNTENWQSIYAQRHELPGVFAACCAEIIETVAQCEYDADSGPEFLIANPQETSPVHIESVCQRYLTAWEALRETFPFLGKSDNKGESWGVF